MKIHIANIPAKLEESALMQLFVQYGQVSSLKIDKDKQSGQRKNTGFVEMRVAEQATKAITNLNGLKVMGYQLSVTLNEVQKGETL